MTDTHATDTAYKAVDFIETFTGRPFYPQAPRKDDVSIIDIAHALSNQCRYSGHTAWFYSTAQHCCLLADYVQVNGGTALDCLQILMHDSAEAYLVDIPRPVKQHMPEFRKWDYAITMCVRSWLGLDGVPIPSWQDEFDSRIIQDERAQVMSDSGLDWQHDCEPLGIGIEPWTTYKAEQSFLLRYALYTRQVFGAYQYLRSAWGVPTHSMYLPPFKTEGGDVPQAGAPDPATLTDLIEVDLRGGVGRVVVRSPNGMMVRDTRAGTFPRPAWKWLHGNFQLSTPNVNSIKIGDVQE
jgi:5'-nucleotidase